MPSQSRRWLHPQAVPRGFLRMYILTLLSKGATSGYSMIQEIEEKTEGIWRPGPGTMYPLLAGLVDEGLASSKSSGAQGRKLYALTAKGRRELGNLQRVISGMGRKEGVMAKLFADILPPDVYVSMVIRRFREGSSTFREKVDRLPEPGRSEVMKEYRLLLEAQANWVDLKLGAGAIPPQSRRKARAP